MSSTKKSTALELAALKEIFPMLLAYREGVVLPFVITEVPIADPAALGLARRPST
jgi:hypothetical protein